MRSGLKRFSRLALASVAAMAVILALTPARASAYFVGKNIVGTTGADLGWAEWESNPAGNHGNGYMFVEDHYCDGDNGIVAVLYDLDRGRRYVATASIRGCGRTQGVHIPNYPNGPAHGSRIEFQVCKLLPNGTHKDCWSLTSSNKYM